MTYQFDPRPEGLHFEPFTAPSCTKTMWFLRDGAPETWIDLRSVFEAMGMSWGRKWGMYCLAKRGQWGLAACCDRTRRETLLAPGNKIPAILGEVHALLGDHYAAARRTRALHLLWRDKYAEIRAGGGKKHLAAPDGKTPARARKRKVNAYVVRQMAALLQKGYSKPEIARVLKVSVAAIKQVAAGAYKLDDEAQAVWWTTFGALQTSAETVITPAKRRAGTGGHVSHSPAGPQRVTSRFKPSAENGVGP